MKVEDCSFCEFVPNGAPNDRFALVA